METNIPKGFDTSTPYHDYTVTEVIARHFWVGETTGYQAVANAWQQIANGKIDELGLETGFVESAGFLHALNTFGKNIHINGHGHKTNTGRHSYVDYRMLKQYTSYDKHEDFVDNGYAVFLNSISENCINKYKLEYAERMSAASTSQQSYLPSKKEHLVSETIVSILCSEFMDVLANSLGSAYGLAFVEAHMLFSGGNWKIEVPWCNQEITSPGTIMAMVAIEDHHPISGVLQISAGSHTLKLDTEIVGDLSTAVKYQAYSKYCHTLANDDVSKIYQHMPMAGDAIAWQGRCLYSDAVPAGKEPKTRNSLIGIFEKVDAQEKRNLLIPVKDRNNLFLVK